MNDVCPRRYICSVRYLLSGASVSSVHCSVSCLVQNVCVRLLCCRRRRCCCIVVDGVLLSFDRLFFFGYTCPPVHGSFLSACGLPRLFFSHLQSSAVVTLHTRSTLDSGPLRPGICQERGERENSDKNDSRSCHQLMVILHPSPGAH